MVRIETTLRAVGVAALLLVTAVASSGCNSDGGDEVGASGDTQNTVPEVSSTTAPTTSTTAPPATDEEAILAAYQAYWDTWIAANDPPNPDHPDLAKYMAGPAYDNAVEVISKHKALGQAVRLPTDAKYRHMAQIAQIEGNLASLADCSVDDAVIVDEQSGTVVDDSVVTRWVFANLVRDEFGQWKVTSTGSNQEWPGEAGCAVGQP